VLTLPFNREVPVTFNVERSCVAPVTSNRPESTIDVAEAAASVEAPLTLSVPPVLTFPFNRDVPVTFRELRACVAPTTSNLPASQTLPVSRVEPVTSREE